MAMISARLASFSCTMCAYSACRSMAPVSSPLMTVRHLGFGHFVNACRTVRRQLVHHIRNKQRDVSGLYRETIAVGARGGSFASVLILFCTKLSALYPDRLLSKRLGPIFKHTINTISLSVNIASNSQPWLVYYLR